MTHNTKILPQSTSRQSLRLLQRLSWMSSLGLLSSFALTQAPANSALKDLASSKPSVPSAAAPGVAVPPLSATPTVVAPAVAAPELSPVPSIIPAESTAPIPSIHPQPSQIPNLSDRDDGPASVVLSERSTGCETEIQFGQGLSFGPCGAPRPVVSPLIASPEATSVAAVQMGPLSVGDDSVGLGSTPRDYYQRTIRPAGRLGNGNISLIFPLSIPAPLSSMFGWRVHPITGDRRFHSGTDLAAPQGTPVLAAYAGQVAIADFMGGYGLAIALNHNQATQQTLYAHLSEIFVKPGEQVRQGDVIGRVGSTGNSTGPHLHFEFRQLTPEGWVAMDSGAQLEYSLAQLVKALEQTAQNPIPRG